MMYHLNAYTILIDTTHFIATYKHFWLRIYSEYDDSFNI